MEKLRLTLVFFLIIEISAFCQDEFDSFVEYFHSIQSDSNIYSNRNEIPVILANKMLGNKIISTNAVSINAIGIINNKDNITLLIEEMFPEAGYTSGYYIVTFSSTGRLLKYKLIGSNSLDSEGGTSCALYLFSDSLLEVKEVVILTSSEGEQYNYKTDYNYYVINKYGYEQLEMIKPSVGRLCPQVSERVLLKNELKVLQPLYDIMRNEIFADHGYIFKIEKWNKYFTNQDWYTPRFEEVANKLTIIEKINIENILKAAPLN